MSFLLINVIILGGMGVFIYFFVESKKIKLFEMITAALYFPFFIYFVMKEKNLLEHDVVPAAILIVVLLEIVAIINIRIKLQELRNSKS
ncbi:MAG: hypothetical protein RR677_04455 [Acinetobacter sp.]|jgi:uncharacterized membrane protein (DUF2068 family)